MDVIPEIMERLEKLEAEVFPHSELKADDLEAPNRTALADSSLRSPETGYPGTGTAPYPPAQAGNYAQTVSGNYPQTFKPGVTSGENR